MFLLNYEFTFTLQEWAANYWHSNGCPKEKLIIGLGTYGRGFLLCNPSETQIGSCAKDGCAAGTYTREKGFLAYYEVKLINKYTESITIFAEAVILQELLLYYTMNDTIAMRPSLSMNDIKLSLTCDVCIYALV